MTDTPGTSTAAKVFISVVLLLAIVFAVGRIVVFQGATLPDANMHPTLSAGDSVMVSLLAEPVAGDVVLISAGGQLMIRRIVAVGGDSVGVFDGGVTHSGKPLPRKKGPMSTFEGARQEDGGVAERSCVLYDETLNGRTYTTCLGVGTQIRGGTMKSVTVPLDEYFVLCDNRLYCGADSRDVGTVARRDVVGRVDYLMARSGEADSPWYVAVFGMWEAL